MTILEGRYKLRWTLELLKGGYTCHTLLDQRDDRWGWVINASAVGWMAHVGAWDRYTTVIPEVVEPFDSLVEARGWVEIAVASYWRRPPLTTEAVREMISV